MKEIPLTRGLAAQVDDRDYDRLMSIGPWHAVRGKHTWYAVRHINTLNGRKTLYMHAAILGTFCVSTRCGDHADGNGLNNRRFNLRRATTAQNNANKRKQRNGTTSQFRGVSTHKRRPGMFRATVKGHDLGFFRTEEDAARAYDRAAIQEFGPFAALNFPKEHQI